MTTPINASNEAIVGKVRLAPDDKVYLSTAYVCASPPSCYPYPDSIYNQTNMNLSVINQPDNLGAACDFQPFSFYLGGKRTYYGLPNNPDYEMGPLVGSGCDSLPLAINNEDGKLKDAINVFPNPCYNKTVITFNGINKNEKVTLMLFNSTGVLLLQKETTASMQEVDVSWLAKGIYNLNVQTKNRRWDKKVVKL